MENTRGTVHTEVGNEKEEISGGDSKGNEVDWDTVPTLTVDAHGQEPEFAHSPHSQYGRFLTAEEFVQRLNNGTQSDKEMDGNDTENNNEKENLEEDENEEEVEPIPKNIASPVGSVRRTLAIIGM